MSNTIPNSERKQAEFNMKQSRVVIESLTCPHCEKVFKPSEVSKNKLGNILTCPDCGQSSNIQAWAVNSMKKRFNQVQQDKVRQYSVITLQNKLRAFNTYIEQQICPACSTKKVISDIEEDGRSTIKCWACGHVLFEDKPDNILTFQGVPVKDLISAMKPEGPKRLKEPLITGPVDMEKELEYNEAVAAKQAEYKEAKKAAMPPAAEDTPATDIPEGEYTEVQQHIITVCAEVADLLITKNRKYGNSALEPVRLFSKADPVEAIKVRIDDKLSRLRNEQDDEDEDVVQDLMGYLVLLQVAKRMKGAKK